MFQKIKEFLFGKLPAEQTPSAPVEAVPYKVETPAPVESTHYRVEEPAPVTLIPLVPAPVQCGCGRSPTGLCVGLHKLSTDEWAVHADNPSKPVAKETAPVKKQPAARKPAAKVQVKKPAAIKAAPKKAAPKKTKAPT
jgi:hypothetical protein